MTDNGKPSSAIMCYTQACAHRHEHNVYFCTQHFAKIIAYSKTVLCTQSLCYPISESAKLRERKVKKFAIITGALSIKANISTQVI